MGLLGVISRMARVEASTSRRASSTEGTKPAAARHGSGTARTPSTPSAMAWLKYQGVGTITEWSRVANAITATTKAWLQPGVMTMSSIPSEAP